ncbi:MAG: hypothetical protein HY430_01940 [Candidatus Levybacteria bacterium]|nr:hypothetical protein [Candidatus Levybacteria bacterium]
MVILIHGDDTANSRNYFLSIKKELPESVLLQAENLTLTDMTQIFEGGSLFSEQKHILIENFFTKFKKSKETDILIHYLTEQGKTHDIYLWEGKTLLPSSINLFKNATQKPFKLPQTLFQFLENVRPNNQKMTLKLYHDTLLATEPEMILFMLIKQFRVLIALTDLKNDQIDEVKRLAPWQKSRFNQQKNQFTQQQLLSHYSKLFEIDMQQKTGLSPYPLSTAIDFFLLAM